MTTENFLKELSGLESDVLLLRRILKQSKVKIPAVIDQAIPLIFDALSPQKQVFTQNGGKSNLAETLLGLFGGGRMVASERGSGHPTVTVNVVNNTNSNVSVNERQDGRGGIALDIMIDQIMAQSLSRPGSQTGRLLNSVFGLSPILSRR